MKNYFISILAIITLFSACKKNDPAPQQFELEEGVFIVSQGAFNADNASLSYFETANNKLLDSLFYGVNGASLGDVAQSINVRDDESFIVVNNSGLIYCIDNKSADVKGKISGLTSPRNLLYINENKAYVSDLYSTSMSIVNPSTFEISGEVKVDRTTEEMVLVGNRAYAANWSAYSQTSKNDVVIVVNTDTDMMIDTIKVGIEPNSMVTDINNNIWVLCSGGFMNDENPSLWKIDGLNGQVLSTLTFQVLESNPSSLKISGSGNELFFLNNGVFKMSVNDNQLPSDPFISQENNMFFVYLGVDPVNGEFYIGDPKDYQSNGIVYRFSSTGEFVNEISAGIIPAAFGFNY